MKRIALTIMIIAAALAVSCGKEEPTQLKLDKKSITCPDGVSEVMLSFTTNYDWTAMSTVSWAKPSSTSGSAGINSISINFDQADVNPRTGYVIISCRELRDTVTVSQGQLDKIEVVNPYVLLDKSGGSFDIKINANVEFNVQIPADVKWLRLDQTKSYEQRTVKMICDVNGTYDDREATLVVKSVNGKLNQTVTVHQSQLDKIMLKDHYVSLGSERSAFSATVCANIDFDVIIPSDVDWIRVNQSKGLSEYSVDFICDENSDADERTADIIFRSADKSLSDTLHVLQARKLMMELSKSEVFVNYEGGEFSVIVSANVEYDIEIPQGDKWISRVTTKGMRDDEIRFKCEGNKLYDDRSTDIIFKSKEGNLKETLHVSQTKTNKMTLSKKNVSLDHKGGDFIATISTNVDYDVEIPKSASWISRIETKGLRDDEVSFRCEANEGYDDRSAQIIFKSKEGNLRDTLTVDQTRTMKMTLSKKEISVKNEGGEISVSVSANVEFDVEIPRSATWISKIMTKGLEDEEVFFRCEQNELYDDRTAEIIFRSREGNLVDTLVVSQARTLKMSLNDKSVTLNKDGGEFSVSINTNVEYEVEIPKTASWISRIETKGLRDDDVHFRCSINEKDDDRRAEIIFKSKEGNLRDTLTVIQTRELIMKLDKRDVSLKKEGGEFNVKVSANVEYDVEIPKTASWISRIETKGMKEDELRFKCEENLQYDDRKADIIFRAREGDLTDTLTVSQDSSLKLKLDKKDVAVESKGGAFSVMVSCNVGYDVMIPATASWIRRVETKGLREDEVCFECDENKLYDDRSAEIVFKSVEGNLYDTLSVLQSSFLKMSLDKKNVTVKSEGGDFSVTVTSNVEFDVIMPQSADWLSTVTTKGLSDYEYHFRCSENQGYDDREAEVVFKSRKGNLSETLKVKQLQKNGLIVSPETMTVSASGGTVEIELQYNVDYEVSCSSSWMSVSEKPVTKGLSSKKYLVDIASYSEINQDRSGQIIFTSGELKGTVTITQTKAKASVVTFTHTRASTGVPTITGTDVSGTIAWGDNKSESYGSAKTHTYTKTQQRTVTVSVKKSSTAVFDGITDISEIDFSEF